MPVAVCRQLTMLSWEMKIKKKLKIVPACLGKFRPTVGQCCHQCTPTRKKIGPNSFLGFHNLLSVKETHTRYRGWLVRRVCCALFVSGCKVYASPVSNRLERVCQSNSVKDALSAEQKAPEGSDSRGQLSHLSPFLPLINTSISPGLLRFLSWVLLKMFSSVFGSIQVNLNHLPALHRASQEVQGSVLVYVYSHQSVVDCALIPLVLFCHSLRVPYTVFPLHITSSFIRSILQKVGVLVPPALTKEDAETDRPHTPVMTSLVRELLQEGQALSVGVAAESGRGGQWLASIRQVIKEGSVPDVSLVPVGISYDCVPKSNTQTVCVTCPHRLASALCCAGCALSSGGDRKELTDSVFGQRRMSWLLPSPHYASELKEPADPERDLSTAVILHLLFSAASCSAVMSTGLVSSLLLYRHHKGVSASALCRDVAWLTEELLFRNKDVGFGGSLKEVVRSSLSLLAPHLTIAAVPSRKDPFIVPRPSLAATLHLSLHAQIVTHSFILEAVGACVVSAMLCEVVSSGVSSRVRNDGVDGEQVSGDMKCDVQLCESELTERALQLSHLLPPGFLPPCQSSQSFALDAVDSLVRCGILIIEEIPRDFPICDFLKRDNALSWTTSDDMYHSDSDCDVEKMELRSYKLTSFQRDQTVRAKVQVCRSQTLQRDFEAPQEPLQQESCNQSTETCRDMHSLRISHPSQCPEMLFFLCRMLAGPMRALCWTTTALDLIHTPLPEAEFMAQIQSYLCDTANTKKQHYESCSQEAAHTAVRSLIDLGVISEQRQRGGVFLGVGPLFQLSENRQKLHRFISQYLYN
ncbi:hypothetical protein F7725_013049 [Dissostichus mawsoni]|uniref:GPAT/DHAPAT C-terminal domain-containing protein n=2 Tax=Notothenioidei TaxID=8205 RepID=A0A7J5YS80_DISMA|nr:hypothetical protein F7725_013049 [Dissostichus mawsoni]